MKLGTAYYPDYFPSTEWSRDLDRMKAAGIGRVRILEFAWSWYQPEPDKWSWDGLDRFLDLALRKEMDVCLATPTATPPPWFFERYPDARLMNDQGQVCWAHRHMTCWNHLQAWEEAARTIHHLAQRYGSHPAVWGWQIDNEPNYAEDPAAFYDFNPHALRDARQWLWKPRGLERSLVRRVLEPAIQSLGADLAHASSQKQSRRLPCLSGVAGGKHGAICSKSSGYSSERNKVTANWG
jgi:beta-galactosidase